MTKKRSVGELRVRIAAAKKCIATLMEIDDPRQPDALAHYRAQLLKLEIELHEQVPPEPIVIGLQPGRISAVALSTE